MCLCAFVCACVDVREFVCAAVCHLLTIIMSENQTIL